MNRTSAPSPGPVLPDKPRLVLRVAFAGSREPPDPVLLEVKLRQIFRTLGRCLVDLAPGTTDAERKDRGVAAWYAARAPLLRLVTGLCEGADEVAAGALARVHDDTHFAGELPGGDAAAAGGASTGAASAPVSDGSPGPTALSSDHLETELAAVLPFALETYRRSRPAAFQAHFDFLAAECAYIVTLDGIYESGNASRAKNRRARAYRAQSAVLLRHADLLVAAADPTASGRAGGTLETVRDGLAFDLPVVFVNTVTGEVRLVEPGSDLHSVLSLAPTDEEKAWWNLLRDQVIQIVADPDTAPGMSAAAPTGVPGADAGAGSGGRSGSAPGAEGTPATVVDPAAGTASGAAPTMSPAGAPRAPGGTGERLLREFFADGAMPPGRLGSDGRWHRTPDWRERVWTWFENRVRSGKASSAGDSRASYAVYRRRTTALNHHYSGMYRGAFLLNYVLAVAAVALAAFSLVLMGTVHSGAGEQLEVIARAVGQEAASVPTPEVGRSIGFVSALLGLGLLKLVILFFIVYNTHLANHRNWNDLAVDYRYLAERLRAMFFLPLAASFRPPAAAHPQYASRIVRQSTVDWLLDAIVRSVSPAEFTTPETVRTYDGVGTFFVRLLRVDPATVVAKVRDDWIRSQADYHVHNALTMQRGHAAAERLGSFLGKAVIAFVAIDVGILVADLLHLLPPRWSGVLDAFSPWLVFLAAVLPAAVASLTGIRFQSECRRLAERSTVMSTMLIGRPKATVTSPTHPIVRAFRTAGHYLRHLVGRPPVALPIAPTGGQWQKADRFAARIARAREEPDGGPGGWALDALTLTEDVAHIFVQEAAEWSVLYAKELPEPG